MTYEALPPKHSKSGRVVEIDGGKAYDLASMGNRALQHQLAAELARVHPNNRARHTAHGPAGGARGHGARTTPAADAGALPRAAESTGRASDTPPGLDFHPGESATTQTNEASA